jgi:acetyl esterase/lipase
MLATRRIAPAQTSPPVLGNLEGLPPAVIVVGADDILLDDNLAMASDWLPPATKWT